VNRRGSRQFGGSEQSQGAALKRLERQKPMKGQKFCRAKNLFDN
jgi:hypothetical protein